MTAVIRTTYPNSDIGIMLKEHIYNVYKTAYGAEVHSRPDRFIYIEDNGDICAGFGVTFASNRALFSEQYIDNLIECYVNTNSRYNIAEIGSCVAIKKGYGLKLYKMLPFLLGLYKCDHALVTLTGKVQGIFDSLQYKTRFLTNADISRVENKDIWGTFYDTKPKTFIFDINQSLPELDLYDYLDLLDLSLSEDLFNLSENGRVAS